MPHAGRGIRYLVTKEALAIGPRSRLEAGDRRAGPRVDGRAHAHGGADVREGEAGRPGDVEATVRGVVIHVALAGMGLAPGILVRRDVLHLRVVGRARVGRGVEISRRDREPVRCGRMGVAGVIVSGGRKDAGEWIDPRARTELRLTRAGAGRVWVR